MRVAGLLVVAVLAWGEAPECNLAPGWEQSGPRRSYEGESLYEYMNGNSEGYLIYGFRKMTGVTCVKDSAKVIVDVSDMGDAEAAYGIFAANRDVKAPTDAIAMGAQILPRKAIVAKGQYYLEIAAEPEGDYRELLRGMATALAGQVSGSTEPPEALSWFPREGLLPGSPRLIPQSVLGIRALKRGYVAQYADGSKAFVVKEPSAEAAAATAEKLRARLAEVEAVGAGFAGRDKYLGTMAVFQKGPFVGGYSGVPEGADAAVLLKRLSPKVQ